MTLGVGLDASDLPGEVQEPWPSAGREGPWRLLPVSTFWGLTISYWLGEHKQVVYCLCFKFPNTATPELISTRASCPENEITEHEDKCDESQIRTCAPMDQQPPPASQFQLASQASSKRVGNNRKGQGKQPRPVQGKTTRSPSRLTSTHRGARAALPCSWFFGVGRSTSSHCSQAVPSGSWGVLQ